ncbi:hypothetical protein ACFQL4_18160 [Halosimplex aquaticum]
MTVVLSTHALGEVEALCDRVAVLDDGTVRAVGTVDEVVRSAGETVTITADYADDAALAAATGAVQSALPEAALTAGETDLELVVSRSSNTEALSALVDTDPESVRVDEPDLETAVREVIAPGGERA